MSKPLTNQNNVIHLDVRRAALDEVATQNIAQGVQLCLDAAFTNRGRISAKAKEGISEAMRQGFKKHKREILEGVLKALDNPDALLYRFKAGLRTGELDYVASDGAGAILMAADREAVLGEILAMLDDAEALYEGDQARLKELKELASSFQGTNS